jgi:hypothetical protein
MKPYALKFKFKTESKSGLYPAEQAGTVSIYSKEDPELLKTDEELIATLSEYIQSTTKRVVSDLEITDVIPTLNILN